MTPVATFRCKVCNMDKPGTEKAPPWKKGRGQDAKLIDMHRCKTCARLSASWNTALKREGQGVIAPRRRTPRRSRVG
jgi:hypothetical protein